MKSHINSLFNSVSYRIGSILFDPGDEWDGFKDVGFVLLTHAHFDHIYGLNRVIELNPNVRIYTNESGREMLFDAKKNLSRYHETPFVVSDKANIIKIENRALIELENGLTAKAIFTPGHNPSCITWVVGEALFTGDAYIPGIKTVTNLPKGSKQYAEQSLTIIKELAFGKIIYPGHMGPNISNDINYAKQI